MCQYVRERSLEGFELTNGCQFGEVSDYQLRSNTLCPFHLNFNSTSGYGWQKSLSTKNDSYQSLFLKLFNTHIQNEKDSDKSVIDLTGAILNFDLIIDEPEDNHILLDGAQIEGNVTISNIGRKCTISMNDLLVKEGGQITLSGPELGCIILTNSNCVSLNIETKEIRGNLKLHNLKLDNEIKLANISVFGPISFKDVQCGGINLDSSTFLDQALFENVSVRNDFSASHSKWQKLTFKNLECGIQLTFKHSEFKKEFSFQNSAVEAYTSFMHLKANASVNIGACHFINVSNFSSACFSKSLSIEKSTFGSYVNFEKSSFHDIYIDECRFGPNINFNQSKFKSATYFLDSSFDKSCQFDNTRFHGDTSFNGSEWLGASTFENAIFDKDVSFSGDRKGLDPAAFGPIRFTNTRFKGRAFFNNRVFKDTTNFSETEFTVAPEFYKAEMHSDVTFRDATFSDRGAHHDQVDAANAYRDLKLKMEGFRNRHEQGRFNVLEQRAKCHTDLKGWDKVLSSLYDVTSEYGTSTSKPIIWLAKFTYALNLIYIGMFSLSLPSSIRDKTDTSTILSQLLNFTIEQIVHPFQLWSQKYEMADGYEISLLVKFIASFQSIASLTLLALFLLALRWRFKRD